MIEVLMQVRKDKVEEDEQITHQSWMFRTV
jgi:hypothetical protein